MDSVSEVIVISDTGNRSANCLIYDLKSGALITSFKDGHSVKRCLCFIGQDYIVSGLNNQPALRVWILNKNLPEMCKMSLPGVPTSLAISNCGVYCVVGIDKIIYVWEIPTGILLTSVQHHSQAVCCLRFSSEGSHLVSGGRDGMVLVWQLSQLIFLKKERLVSSSESCDSVKPRYVWVDHAAEVTDLFIGSLGIFSRVVTVSKDMTCRIYELETGNHITTIHVEYPITAATMDESEYFLVLGSAEGIIFRINLFAVNTTEMHFNSADKEFAFVGHNKEITCLSVSTTGKYLVSGSEDGDCRIWDMVNFACIRKINLVGAVTNAFIAVLPPGLRSGSRYYPRLKVCNFKKHYEDTGIEYITTSIQSRKLSLMHLGSPDEYFDSRLLNSSEESLVALNRNSLSTEMMTVINNQMYAYALCEGYDQPEDFESQVDDSD